MRFHVESWSPAYGAAAVDALVDASADVDVSVEVPAHRWAPVSPGPGPEPSPIVFVDGVRRVDARVWVDTAGSGLRQGICASYAAGAVRCDGRAVLVDARVERGVFCCGEGVESIDTRHGRWLSRPATGEAPEQLWLAVQARMGDLEAAAAAAAARLGAADLVVVDGPLRDRRHLDGAVGYVKSHHVRYLQPGQEEVIGALAAGQRTPLFAIGPPFPRWSWYLRLPFGVGHPWAGVVRGEAPPALELAPAVAVADATAKALPRFASEQHKDGRAPQNLHPIAGLERALRRRLGDAALLERALRVAAARRR
jgi:hypothetical protein